MKNEILTILLVSIITVLSSAQKRNSSYIFGNSLVHHEFQVNPTQSQETSVPHWLHYLSEASNYEYEVSGQYGFLPQHAELPPISNWSFDFAFNAWDSENELFEEADFTNVIITPGNFIQWQAPNVNYPMEQVSPISTTEEIINWSIDQEESINIFIYEGWPDMSPFLSNGFPPNQDEWLDYDQYMNSEFHNWYVKYLDILKTNTSPHCLKVIPVGSLLSHLLKQEPYNQIPIADLYEDDAPHGKPTIYFLAALITYMTTYEEIAPLNYQVDPIIHPIVIENYQNVVSIIWEELNTLKDDLGNSQIFCNNVVSNLYKTEIDNEINISPNPFHDYFQIVSSTKINSVDLLNIHGDVIINSMTINSDQVILKSLDSGIYVVRGKDKKGQIIGMKRVIKI